MINFTYKFVLCTLRKLGMKDESIAPVSSFMASLWLKHDSTDQRPGILTGFLIGKLMDFLSV